MRTVYKHGCVDASTWYRAGQVPHLVQWPALREYDDDAYEAEGEQQGDCGFAEALEGFFRCCGYVSVTNPPPAGPNCAYLSANRKTESRL